MENNYVTYQIDTFKGALGDFATEWWTEEDWNKWKKYIEELKVSGELGKPITLYMSLIPFPELDTPINFEQKDASTCKFIIIDLNDSK